MSGRKCELPHTVRVYVVVWMKLRALGGNRDIMVEVSIDREMRAKEEMEEMV